MKITPHLNSIAELVRENDSISINANTGTGKSIMIPGTIAERMKMKVFVSVPKVTSSSTLATFAQKVFPNIRVGYGAEGNKSYDMFTDVVYGTSDHIRRKMYSYVSGGKFIDITFCDLLIIDEMHTLSIDNDVIMSMLMESKEQGKKIPKVMFMHSRSSHAGTSAYIAGPAMQDFYIPKPVVYNVDISHPYPIELIYHHTNVLMPSSESGITFRYKEIVNVTSNLREDDGDVLILVHEKKAADDIADDLIKIFPNDMVIPAYPGMKSEEFELIYQKTTRRKIIVATNAMEASIAIDGLGVVIDSLLENRTSTSETGGLKISISRICKDTARQRLGRIGQTRNGKCIRMMTAMTYDNLDEHITPEIYRVPINELVMEFVNKGLNPETSLRGITKDKVRDSMKLLSELDAINDDKVTDLGHFLQTVPFSVRNGAFIYHWTQRGYPIFPGIVIAAILDNYQAPGYFSFPKRRKNQDDNIFKERLGYFFREKIGHFKGHTQLHTFLNLWDSFARVFRRDLYKIVQSGEFHGTNRALFHKWATMYSVHQRKFNDLLNNIREIYTNVGDIHIGGTGNKKIGLFNTRNASTSALEIIPLCYSGNLIKLEYGHTYKHNSSQIPHVLASLGVFSDMENGDYPEKVFAIGTLQVKNKITVSLSLPYYSDETEKERWNINEDVFGEKESDE
jgi:HrpA-like RNA helicase